MFAKSAVAVCATVLSLSILVITALSGECHVTYLIVVVTHPRQLW